MLHSLLLSFVSLVPLNAPVFPDKRGKITMFADTFGDPSPAGITAGPDGALWFTDPGNDVIGRVTTRGKMTQFSGGGVELSPGITSGPDGALWYTVEQSAGEIGRITTNGTVTLFPVGADAYPQAITTGPDGALWFTTLNGIVGRITTSGNVTNFPVAASNAMLSSIVTGPDGALWVVQSQTGSREANSIIRLTTSGQMKTFTVGDGPQTICVGPDGALWFTESGAIGRITTKGKYSAFAIHGASAFPVGIAAGPDGALWFTVSGTVGRTTTSGKMRFFEPPSGYFGLQQITAGPDGAMWFASFFSPAIGRITT